MAGRINILTGGGAEEMATVLKLSLLREIAGAVWARLVVSRWISWHSLVAAENGNPMLLTGAYERVYLVFALVHSVIHSTPMSETCTPVSQRVFMLYACLLTVRVAP